MNKFNKQNVFAFATFLTISFIFINFSQSSVINKIPSNVLNPDLNLAIKESEIEISFTNLLKYNSPIIIDNKSNVKNIFEIISTKNISSNSSYVEPSNGEHHINNEPTAAKVVDGKSIVMKDKDISDFEKKLYSAKTREEYETILKSVQYYNKGVDVSKFDWYWDDFKNIYTPAQIEFLKSGKYETKKVPNLIGMKSKDAYQKLIDMGFLVTMYYHYENNSKFSLDCCYFQDPPAGALQQTSQSVSITIQAPREISMEAIPYNPNDKGFDIFAIAKDIRENKWYSVYMPKVTGLSAKDAKQKLEDAGFINVSITYLRTSDKIAAGLCYDQQWDVGSLISNKYFLEIMVQPEGVLITNLPNLVDMPYENISSLLNNRGILFNIENYNPEYNNLLNSYCSSYTIEYDHDKKTEYIRMYMRYQ